MSNIKTPQTTENKRENRRVKSKSASRKTTAKTSKPKENRATRQAKNHPLSTVLIAASFAD